MNVLLAIVVFVVGAVLLGHGLSLDAQAETAMHQIYSAIYVAGGVMTIALAFVIRAVGTAAAAAGEVVALLKAEVASKAKAEKERIDKAYHDGVEAVRKRAEERAPAAQLERKPYVWGSAGRLAEDGTWPCPNCGRDVPGDSVICECGYGRVK